MRWRGGPKVRGPAGRLTEGGARVDPPAECGPQPSENSARAALQPTAFTLGKAAPDPKPLIVAEGVFEAFGTNVAAAAHPLRLPGRSALFREEGLRVGLGAERLLLPGQEPGLVVIDVVEGEAQLCHDASFVAGTRDLAGTVAPGRGKNTSEITRAS